MKVRMEEQCITNITQVDCRNSKRQLIKGGVLDDCTIDGDFHTEEVRSMA
jgi:hypothetical protein